MEIYDILEEFNFKFAEEDITRKWRVFGGPKDVINMIVD